MRGSRPAKLRLQDPDDDEEDVERDADADIKGVSPRIHGDAPLATSEEMPKTRARAAKARREYCGHADLAGAAAGVGAKTEDNEGFAAEAEDEDEERGSGLKRGIFESPTQEVT